MASLVVTAFTPRGTFVAVSTNLSDREYDEKRRLLTQSTANMGTPDSMRLLTLYNARHVETGEYYNEVLIPISLMHDAVIAVSKEE